jgi:hypothetical protein
MKIWPLFLIAGGAIALFQFGVVEVSDFVQIGCRGKQAEARKMLKETRKRLHRYAEQNNGRLTSNFGDLAWDPRGERYVYLIQPSFDGRFIVEANAKTKEMNGDVWQIDEVGTLTNKVNGCAAVARD